MLLPSKVISDQYASTTFVLKAHNVIEGRIEKEDDKTIVVRPSPLSTDTVIIEKKDLRTRALSRLSPMPEGLLDVLEKDEILDLLAYIRSGGNQQDEAFTR